VTREGAGSGESQARAPAVHADQIALNIDVVRAKIEAACERAGRSVDNVTLIAVTKTHGVDEIAAAYEAGVRDFGENRVQEARPKIIDAKEHGVNARWHLIGHLQTNKVKAAIESFDILHTIDSERLARSISERATRPIEVLIEVNVAGEAQKSGIRPDAAAKLAEAAGTMPHLQVRGLMTVAPQADDPEDVRPVFRELRALRDSIGLQALSMGMTDDYEVAVEEGSTLVRVGRALFGARMP
jgi:pyridoxal phosphate enzyme (YggS family)